MSDMSGDDGLGLYLSKTGVFTSVWGRSAEIYCFYQIDVDFVLLIRIYLDLIQFKFYLFKSIMK